MSHERRDYESVDERRLRILSYVTRKKEFMQ